MSHVSYVIKATDHRLFVQRTFGAAIHPAPAPVEPAPVEPDPDPDPEPEPDAEPDAEALVLGPDQISILASVYATS